MFLGLPSDGSHFDAINLNFHEIIIKGGLHASVEDMVDMLKIAAEHMVYSQLTLVPIGEAENLPERSAARQFKGKAVIMI